MGKKANRPTPPEEDVREQKPAEASEEFFVVFLESISDGFVFYDRDWHYVYVNEHAAQMIGRKKEELVGKTLYELFPERIDTPIFQEFQRIMEEGKPTQLDYFSPGAQRWLRTNFYPSPVGMATIFADITEEIVARQQLEASEKHYRTLFNSIDEGFCVIEKVDTEPSTPLDFRYLEANPAFEAQTGVGNVVGKTIRQAFPGETENWYETYDRIVRTGEPVRFERGLATQGRVLELYAFRVDDETKRRVAVIFKDITEQRRAEQVRDEHERKLAVNEERERLARELHDSVSQSLFSASTITEVLPRLLRDKPERALTQIESLHQLIRGASAEMRTLLHELRPESIVQNKLSVLLTQLAYAAQARAEIAISVHTHGDDAPTLAPEVHIAFYRIAQESINNILKHANASDVKVRLRRIAGYAALVVSDNGDGFDSEVGGAGFGLKIMRERAESIGAALDVKSRIGKGTHVRLVWAIGSLSG